MWYVGIIEAKDLQNVVTLTSDIVIDVFSKNTSSGIKYVVILTQYSKDIDAVRRRIRYAGIWIAYNGKEYNMK